MKTILFCAAVLTLLTTTGCLVTEGRSYRGRGHGHGHRPAVLVPAPVVVVPAPVIIVPVRPR